MVFTNYGFQPLKQIIYKPTRVNAETESLIDIIMVSSPYLIEESGT